MGTRSSTSQIIQNKIKKLKRCITRKQKELNRLIAQTRKPKKPMIGFW